MAPPHLEKFHDALKTKLIRARWYRENSCFISLVLNLTVNKKQKCIKEAGIHESLIPKDALGNLLESGFVRESDEAGMYEITAKGLWQVEGESMLENDKMVDYIDRKYFHLGVKPLGEKDKVLLLGMVATRCFSKDTCLDCHEQEFFETWREVFYSSYEILRDQEVVKTDDDGWHERLEKDKQNENAISYFARNSHHIPKNVKRIFVAPGDQRYYLDIGDGDELDASRLKVVFSKIFGDRINYDNLDEIVEFCRDMSDKYGHDLYASDNPFLHPTYEEAIMKSAEDSIPIY